MLSQVKARIFSFLSGSPHDERGFLLDAMAALGSCLRVQLDMSDDILDTYSTEKKKVFEAAYLYQFYSD
jgi:hypothetical protein